MRYRATINGLIECLTDIKNKCGGDTFVHVNALGHDCCTGLTSVCVDNNEGNETALVYIETDLEENYYPATFELYTQGEEL